MKRREYYALSADVRRLRPLIVIVLTVVILLPSFDAMLTQGLSPLTVLVRFAESLAFLGLLVWMVSGVILYYARIQLESQQSRDRDGGTHA
jgi:hypothetical protein